MDNEASRKPTKNKESSLWQKILDNTTALLGIVSTSLAIFITTTTLAINERTAKLEATNIDLNNKLTSLETEIKNFELINVKYENAVRVEAEFRVFNANAFASSYKENKEKGMRIVWLDKQSRTDIEKYINDWQNGNKLMTGKSSEGLFARQVVCLQLINLGKTPARKVNLTIKTGSFDNKNGTFGKAYYELDPKEQNWVEKQVPLGDLVEMSHEGRLKTEILIPLAHVSGSNRYFGQLAIPLKVTWYDEREQKDSNIFIDIKNENGLKNDLESSILGISNY